MKGYRLTTLGKVVVFSLLFLIILSTAYTVKALMYHQTYSKSTPNHISSKVVSEEQKSQINITNNTNTTQANGTDSYKAVDIDKLEKTKLTIYFDPDDAIIKDQYSGALDMFINVADTLKDFFIEIEGNCATVYKDAADNRNNLISYNLSLSRAKAVLNYFQKKGIDPNRIVIVGNGSNKPVRDNTSEEGRKYNRRVEISFKLKK